jgi:hypothetical protein
MYKVRRKGRNTNSLFLYSLAPHSVGSCGAPSGQRGLTKVALEMYALGNHDMILNIDMHQVVVSDAG